MSPGPAHIRCGAVRRGGSAGPGQDGAACRRETMTFGPLVVTFDERVLRPRPWTMLQASWAAELRGRGAGRARPRAVLGRRPHRAGGGGAHRPAPGPGRRRPARLRARRGERGGERHRRPVQVALRRPRARSLRPEERFPVVLADPPYLARDEVDDWPLDPTHAIDGGPDGLDLPRRCLAVAGAHVAADGVVLLQARGREQVEQLAADLAAAGLELVDVRAWDERRAVALLRPAVRGAPHARRARRLGPDARGPRPLTSGGRGPRRASGQDSFVPGSCPTGRRSSSRCRSGSPRRARRLPGVGAAVEPTSDPTVPVDVESVSPVVRAEPERHVSGVAAARTRTPAVDAVSGAAGAASGAVRGVPPSRRVATATVPRPSR